MERLLVKLMVVAAMAQLGLSAKDLLNPWQIRKAAGQVAHIDWKPISLFPEEAKRFR